MAHIHELVDFVVTVLIVYRDKVLLVHHKELNVWLPVGGHIELNENPDEALFREIKEECGLDVEILGEKPVIPDASKSKTVPLYRPMSLDEHTISETHKHISLTYFAKAKSDKFIHNKEEHNDIRWFSAEDLDNPKYDIAPGAKFYAKEALKKLGSEL